MVVPLAALREVLRPPGGALGRAARGDPGRVIGRGRRRGRARAPVGQVGGGMRAVRVVAGVGATGAGERAGVACGGGAAARAEGVGVAARAGDGGGAARAGGARARAGAAAAAAAAAAARREVPQLVIAVREVAAVAEAALAVLPPAAGRRGRGAGGRSGNRVMTSGAGGGSAPCGPHDAARAAQCAPRLAAQRTSGRSWSWRSPRCRGSPAAAGGRGRRSQRSAAPCPSSCASGGVSRPPIGAQREGRACAGAGRIRKDGRSGARARTGGRGVLRSRFF
jgi:hypothetical protein